MSRRVSQSLFLIWLCLYLAGPLVQTVDFWDTPQDEMTDVASSLCGTLIWMACAASLARFALQQLRKCWGRIVGREFVQPLLQWSEMPLNPSFNEGGFTPIESPPLRI